MMRCSPRESRRDNAFSVVVLLYGEGPGDLYTYFSLERCGLSMETLVHHEIWLHIIRGLETPRFLY